MLKRELKINFKNLIIWTSILLLLFLMVFMIYPSIINSSDTKSLDDMLKMFPKSILKAFNMDISGINSAFGWFKTEGNTIYLLIGSLYSSILGSNILLKEESDKTIYFLNSLPISRNNIISTKVLTGIINITFMVIIVLIFNIIGFYLINDLDIKNLVLLSITPLMCFYSFFLISIATSTLFHKTKKMQGISLGIVFISYIMQIISLLSNKYSYLKYFSIFTLASSRDIINNNFNNYCLVVFLIISIISLAFTYYNYNKKELL